AYCSEREDDPVPWKQLRRLRARNMHKHVLPPADSWRHGASLQTNETHGQQASEVPSHPPGSFVPKRPSLKATRMPQSNPLSLISYSLMFNAQLFEKNPLTIQ